MLLKKIISTANTVVKLDLSSTLKVSPICVVRCHKKMSNLPGQGDRYYLAIMIGIKIDRNNKYRYKYGSTQMVELSLGELS